MKSINTYAFAISLLLGALFLAGCAAERVVKRSERNRPNWVYGMQSGYFISSGSGKSFEEAQVNALTNLKDMVIKSIAVQVVSKSTSNTNETMGDQFSDYLSTYENNIEVYSEYFQPLKGLSASNVESFYWEVVKMDNGLKEIRYHIKYPFSQMQLNELIRDFEALDAEMERKLQEIEQNGKQFESIEAIIDDIRKVEGIMAILPRSKRARAVAKIEELESVLDDISFIVLDDSSGFLSYELRLYGDPITVSKAPDIFASCPISIIEFKAFKHKNNVRYDRSKCQPFREEKLSVEYKFSERKVRRNFVIPEAKSGLSGFDVKNLSIENLGLGAGICRFEILNLGNVVNSAEIIGLSFYQRGYESKRTRVELTPYREVAPKKSEYVEQRFRFPFKKGLSVLNATISQSPFVADLEIKASDGQVYTLKALPLKFSF